MHEYSKMITAQLLRSSCEAHGTCGCDGLCTDSWCEIAGDTRHGDGLSAKLGKPHEGSLVDEVCNPLRRGVSTVSAKRRHVYSTPAASTAVVRPC